MEHRILQIGQVRDARHEIRKFVTFGHLLVPDQPNNRHSHLSTVEEAGSKRYFDETQISSCITYPEGLYMYQNKI